jgi:hypothetical protein
MTTYAFVEDGVVREVVHTPPGTPMLKHRYHADLLPKFVPVVGLLVPQVAPGWRWDGSAFLPPAPPPPPGPTYIPAGILRERMEAAGKWDAMAAMLVDLMATQPGLVLKLLTLNEGVDPADPQARALIVAAGADPNVILAP